MRKPLISIYNTMALLGICMFTEEVLDVTMKEVKTDCIRWGIDFEKSKNVKSKDCIVFLQ